MGQAQSCNGRGKVLDGLGDLVGVHFGGLELWVGPVNRAAGPLSLCSKVRGGALSFLTSSQGVAEAMLSG